MTALPAGLLLFYTGIYIRFSRGENYLWLGEDARVFQRTILTAVVAAKLYAGTHDVERNESWMSFVGRTESWATSRRLLRRHGLMQAFCCAAPGAPSGKWISSAIFAIY